MTSALQEMVVQLSPLWSQNYVFMLACLTATLGVYLLSRKLHLWLNQNPLLHPLTVSTLIIGLGLHFTEIDVVAFKRGITLFELLLGPATVALAVPLYNQLPVLRQLGVRVLAPILIGGSLAPTIAWLSVYLLETPLQLQMTMLVKSITTPLAMGTAELIGGTPELAAVIVILTGIVGATFGPWLIILSKTDSEYAQGLALGSVAHVIGTSKALSISETCGAFATLGLCLNGILTALLLPILFA
ncbi:MAG: putative effector of murein hydrolase [Gammaproteobacteria bacterium]|jgi:putative effector of murein hydrolase